MTAEDAMKFSRMLAARRGAARWPGRRSIFSACRGTCPWGKMSKGMKRQLALTLTVAQRPELLILDEPTSGLDPERRRDFLNVILKSVTEGPFTVIMSSHQLHEIERVTDRVALCAAGGSCGKATSMP